MKPTKTVTVAIFLLVFLMTACNLPTVQTTEPATLTPVASSTPTAEPTSTATPTLTVTLTATPSMPIVTVTTATNCRTGPGANYGFVMLFTPGMSAPVVGKYTPSYYWIITLPDGGTCWLWGAYANVEGDLSVLPEVAAPAPPVAAFNPTAPPSNSSDNNSQSQDSGNNESASQDQDSSGDSGITGIQEIGPLTVVTPMIPIFIVPLTPTSLKVSSYCEYSSLPPYQVTLRTDTLVWAQVNNADGYIIYMNGAQLFKVSKTTLGYQISPQMSPQASTYGIASYIGNVTSDIRSATPKGCQ